MPTCRQCHTETPRPAFCSRLCNHNFHYALRKAGKRIPRTYQQRRKPTLAEAAYIAGYFDGEGCVTFQGYRSESSYTVIVCFTQSRENAILLMREIYGGYLSLPRVCGNSVRQRVDYRISQKAGVLCFLSDILPYVREKRDQVVEVIDLLSHGGSALSVKARISAMKRAPLNEELVSAALSEAVVSRYGARGDPR